MKKRKKLADYLVAAKRKRAAAVILRLWKKQHVRAHPTVAHPMIPSAHKGIVAVPLRQKKIRYHRIKLTQAFTEEKSRIEDKNRPGWGLPLSAIAVHGGNMDNARIVCPV